MGQHPDLSRRAATNPHTVSNFTPFESRLARKEHPFMVPGIHWIHLEPVLRFSSILEDDGTSDVASLLPSEILDIIATFLCGDVHSILNFSLVCRRFREIVSSGHVWKTLFSDRFPLTPLANPEDPVLVRDQFFALHEKLGSFSFDPLLQGAIPDDSGGEKPMPDDMCSLPEHIFRLFARIPRVGWLDGDDEGGSIILLQPEELFEGKFVVLVQTRSYFQYEEFEEWYVARWEDFYRGEQVVIVQDDEKREIQFVELAGVFGPRLLQLANDGILFRTTVFVSIVRILCWIAKSLRASEVDSLIVYTSALELPTGDEAWWSKPEGLTKSRTPWHDEEIQATKKPREIGGTVTKANLVVFRRGFFFDLRIESSASCGHKDYSFGEGVLILFSDGTYSLDCQDLVTLEVEGIMYS